MSETASETRHVVFQREDKANLIGKMRPKASTTAASPQAEQAPAKTEERPGGGGLGGVGEDARGGEDIEDPPTGQ
jgi:hypothetical protein